MYLDEVIAIILKTIMISFLIIILFVFLISTFNLLVRNEVIALKDTGLIYNQTEKAKKVKKDVEYGEGLQIIEGVYEDKEGNVDMDVKRRTIKSNNGTVNTPYVYDNIYE